MLQGRSPIRWRKIADLVPSRTGKQCRERYFNHLNPTLNHSEWSLVEDALLVHFHGTIGPRWVAIAGLLRGRTNNSAKNRFHHIRRQLEKDMTRLCQMSQDSEYVKLNLLRLLSKYCIVEVPDSSMDVVLLLVDSFKREQALLSPPHGHNFDLVVTSGDCSRCGLLVPAKQTGQRLCVRTGWCETCVSTPAYLSSDLMRKIRSKMDASDHEGSDVN